MLVSLLWLAKCYVKRADFLSPVHKKNCFLFATVLYNEVMGNLVFFFLGLFKLRSVFLVISLKIVFFASLCVLRVDTIF